SFASNANLRFLTPSKQRIPRSSRGGRANSPASLTVDKALAAHHFSCARSRRHQTGAARTEVRTANRDAHTGKTWPNPRPAPRSSEGARERVLDRRHPLRVQHAGRDHGCDQSVAGLVVSRERLPDE